MNGEVRSQQKSMLWEEAVFPMNGFLSYDQKPALPMSMTHASCLRMTKPLVALYFVFACSELVRGIKL
jgi:hypothetical protein